MALRLLSPLQLACLPLQLYILPSLRFTLYTPCVLHCACTFASYSVVLDSPSFVKIVARLLECRVEA